MNEHQSCSESSTRSSSVTPMMTSISPLPKLPKWERLGSYVSAQKVVSEGSRHTSNPNSPRSSIGSFPKLVREATSPNGSPSCAPRAHSALSNGETDGSNRLLRHLCLLFCNVLPSVLLSILCVTLTEAANLLQRVVNYLQMAGKSVETNRTRSHTFHSPSSSASNFHRTFSPRTPSVCTAKSEMGNYHVGGIPSGSSNINDHPEPGQSQQENLGHLVKELAMMLMSSQNLSEAEHAIARHFIVRENVIQRREPFLSPPIIPVHTSLDDLGQPPPESWCKEKKLPESNQMLTQADEVDDEDCRSSSSSSSAALSTKCTEENAASLRHREVTYETMDEAGPPSLDFMSPLCFPVASSPATENTEILSQVDSPTPLPPPLSISQSLIVGQEEEEIESESDRDTVDRDSLIGAKRVLSTSERSAEGLLRSPPVSEKSFTFQPASLIEDYDSDQMIVAVRAMKPEEKCPSLEEPNFLELLRNSNVQTSSSDKQASPEEDVGAGERLSERDVRHAIEAVDDENDVVESSSADAGEEKKLPDDMSSIDREISAYYQEKPSNREGSQTPFLQSRQRSSIDFSNIQDGRYSTVIRSTEPQSRENRLIPLQNVGRSQSSAEKPVSDWTEITPYEADKESRLSRRHLSDLSFGVRERQKDMLPKELIAEDFPSDESSDMHEPAIERFRANKWKRGIKAACRDVSECRKLVANLWKRRKSGTPTNAGLHGPTAIYRADSHKSQVRRNDPSETGVKFDIGLSQDTVFKLLIRHCPEYGISVVARKPNHKLKVTVRIPECIKPLLLSIHLTRLSHSRVMSTTVVLTRSRDDQSGAHRKHIEITGFHLRKKLEENLIYHEDSDLSNLLEDSGL